jgi:hypothetical protein
MDARILSEFKRLVASGARIPMLEYLEARAQDATNSLVSCNMDQFRQYQGRVLELQELIKLIKAQ